MDEAEQIPNILALSTDCRGYDFAKLADDVRLKRDPGCIRSRTFAKSILLQLCSADVRLAKPYQDRLDQKTRFKKIQIGKFDLPGNVGDERECARTERETRSR